MSEPVASVADVLRTALLEHETERGDVGIGASSDEADLPSDTESWILDITKQLSDSDNIPPYSSRSSPLSLVSFRCMLQDTGYPLEIYQLEDSFHERWIGWAIEIPGQRRADTTEANGSTSSERDTPEAIRRKFPLRDGHELGAIIKIYEDVSLKPASVHTFTGILSFSPLPSEDDTVMELPTLHVLARSDGPDPRRPPPAARKRTIDHLASAFSPSDQVAAELLLLSLLAHPVSREPLVGGLTVNLVGKPEWSLASMLENIVPAQVSLPLSIPTLHTERFEPNALLSTSLDAGLLQLAYGTLLVVDESGLGDGGKLDEKAYANLRALNNALTEQRLRYLYPYMENLFMDCALKGVVLSERSSLTPTDLKIPVTYAPARPDRPADLEACREYVEYHSSAKHAEAFKISDDTASLIQNGFIDSRRTGSLGLEEAESTLKRRMKIARLLAISHETATLTPELWRHTVTLDEELERRLGR